MSSSIIWLFIFVAMYWSYCVFWGIKGARTAKTASDYFIAGRSIGVWVFVLAATATSFSGWTFVGHPALVWRDGMPYGFASFYAITIPLTGVIFLKRQWLLGKRYGFVTPGEMFSTYYNSEAMRLLTLLVALVFSVPYLGIQLKASGILFNVLSHGALDVNVGMWMLSAVVVIYVTLGGLRSVAYVDTMQAILLAVGIVAIGAVTLNLVGGWDALQNGIARLAKNELAHVVTNDGRKIKLIDAAGNPIVMPAYESAVKGFMTDDGKSLARTSDGAGRRVEFWSEEKLVAPDTTEVGSLVEPNGVAWASQVKKTPDGLPHFVAIPGSVQFVTPGTNAQGGVWTGLMILTYMFALMGIQSAPAFSMWAFANRNPTPFAPQQVWASAFGIGLILITYTWIQGLGAHVLVEKDILAPFAPGSSGDLVPKLIDLLSDTAPAFVGLLAVCALAAMQSTGAAYMSTASGMLTRDLYKRYFRSDLSHTAQKFFGRVSVVVIVLAALIMAMTANDALVMLGGLAVAYGFQMWPALVGALYWKFLTKEGVVTGLIAGLVAVTVTYVDADLKYAWTIHSAGWGIIFNLTLAILVSFVTQPKAEEAERKGEYHAFLATHCALPAAKRKLIPVAWIATVGWFLLAIGPFTTIGNTIFGDPVDASTWTFGMPSLWAWAIIWWGLGVALMWFLAYFMEMSTNIKGEFEGIDDYADEAARKKAPVRLDLETP